MVAYVEGLRRCEPGTVVLDLTVTAAEARTATAMLRDRPVTVLAATSFVIDGTTPDPD